MATQSRSPTSPDDEKPPFLQEATEIVERQPDLARSERFIEAINTWRLALGAALIPVVLIAVALAGGTSSSRDSIAAPSSADEPSSVESMVRGVVPTTPPDHAAGDDATPTSGAMPLTSAPPSIPESSAVTGSTVASSVGSEPIRCLITVAEQTVLRDEPDETAERLRDVAPGGYPGYESRDDAWYRIDVDGTIGWLGRSAVSDVRGVCTP